MKSLMRFIIIASLFVAGCGENGDLFDVTVPTQLEPYINRIAPNNAKAGDIVTIFGFGFSDVPELNVVIIDGVEAFAETYSLVSPPVQGEVESLTFTVPAGLTVGNHSIYVDVLDNVSNTNTSITINP